jgi:predicted O-linked N-acetylglucosamine transferase (SPINDLY family)
MKSGIRIQDPFEEVGATNFYLAYHGKSNRELQSLVARFYINACPELLYTAPHCRGLPDRGHGGRIRIGFISRFFTDHSIGKTTRGLIAGLDREKYSVTVFFLDPPAGRLGKIIESSADESVVVPNNLDAARQCIAARELQILLYPDIGMESFTYYLAYSRLAPVQCTSFGHPDTTGIPGIDYFISSECYETERGEEHYSERLVRLKGVSSLAYYLKPEVPELLRERADFGLRNDDHIYICPQHLFKFHPDFDAILAGILRADAYGRIVIIEGQHAHWGCMLRDRFHAVMPDVCERIQFIPRQTGPDFINIIAVADVMLDTMYFCGQNTSHEGLAAGTPIVTLPGELQRSRHTMCFLKAIGLEECIACDADDYIRIAVRLGTDPGYRDGIKTLIRKNAHRVWEEKAVISEYERFFHSVVTS